MLSMLLKKAKKLVVALILAALMSAVPTVETQAIQDDQFIRVNVQEVLAPQQVAKKGIDVVIRVGEYEGKAGKRVYVNGQTINIPNDIPVRNDGDGKGFYISEYDINLKVAKKIINFLEEAGVGCKLQVANGKKEDLNAAGRIANKIKPKMYISVHHNSFNETSNGYFAMYNQNDNISKKLAQDISDALAHNGKVVQRSNRPNDGYIGELNVLDKDITAVLLELGFYSNLSELEVICSDHQTYFNAKYIAQEIIKNL